MLDKDILLNEKHDLDIVNFDLQLTNDNQVVAQRVKQALLLFKGEWFLNRDIGIPYFENILGTRNSIDSVRSIFINAIRNVDGVKDLKEFNMDFEDETRLLAIEAVIIDELDNEINIKI